MFELAVAAQPANAHTVEREINDGRGVERKYLADNQAADDGDAERAAKFGAGAGAESERERAEERGHGGHQNRTEAQDAGLEDSFLGILAIDTFGHEGEVDHHDGVFLDDTDKQDDADEGDDAEVQLGDEKSEHGADAGGRQGGQNGDGMNVALVEDAENDIDGEQRSDDEKWLSGEGRLEGLERA